MKEKWAPVIGYEGIYDVSDFGRVRRIKPAGGTRKNRLLKPEVNESGYSFCYLYNLKRRRKFYIHYLVAQAFIGERPHKFQVHHKNGNQFDNTPSNLCYISRRENILNSIKNGTHFIPKGSQHGGAKLTEAQCVYIKKRYSKGDVSYRWIADKFGIKSISTIARIVHEKGWTHIK